MIKITHKFLVLGREFTIVGTFDRITSKWSWRNGEEDRAPEIKWEDIPTNEANVIIAALESSQRNIHPTFVKRPRPPAFREG